MFLSRKIYINWKRILKRTHLWAKKNRSETISEMVSFQRWCYFQLPIPPLADDHGRGLVGGGWRVEWGGVASNTIPFCRTLDFLKRQVKRKPDKPQSERFTARVERSQRREVLLVLHKMFETGPLEKWDTYFSSASSLRNSLLLHIDLTFSYIHRKQQSPTVPYLVTLLYFLNSIHHHLTCLFVYYLKYSSKL